MLLHAVAGLPHLHADSSAVIALVAAVSFIVYAVVTIRGAK